MIRNMGNVEGIASYEGSRIEYTDRLRGLRFLR